MQTQFHPLDTKTEIVTPENIAFEYRLAGPFRRMAAYGLDVLIQMGIIVVSLIVLGLIFSAANAGEVGVGAWLLIMFAINWFYGGLFETFWNGQTPGKRSMQIRTVSVDGQPVTALQAVLRNLLRVVDTMPTFAIPVFGEEIAIPLSTYQLGLLTATCNRRFQRLGDIACGTMVICHDRRATGGVPRLGDARVLAFADEIPRRFRASPSLARALSLYVARRLRFSPHRRRIIALHLAQPLAEQFGFPSNTDPDLLLCALYQNVFFGDSETAAQLTDSSTQGTRQQPKPSDFIFQR